MSIVLQRFIIILTDHLVQCEAEGRDYNTPWYKWVIERLHQVFLMVCLIIDLWTRFIHWVWQKPLHPEWYIISVNTLLLSASWTSLQIHQYLGKSSLHKWHWHSYPWSVPAVLCFKIIVWASSRPSGQDWEIKVKIQTRCLRTVFLFYKFLVLSPHLLSWPNGCDPEKNHYISKNSTHKWVAG